MGLGVIARDQRSAPFFDAAARGQLLVQRCRDCQTGCEPAVTACFRCHGTRLDWQPASGRGAVASWVVQPGRRHGAGHAPPPDTVVALVELAEGPWLTLQVQQVTPDQLHAGMAVTVHFSRPDGGEPVPYARPAPAASAS